MELIDTNPTPLGKRASIAEGSVLVEASIRMQSLPANDPHACWRSSDHSGWSDDEDTVITNEQFKSSYRKRGRKDKKTSE